MIEVTVTVPDKEEILNELERVNKLYPYTDLSEAWDTAYDYAYSTVDCELDITWKTDNIKLQISNYIDLVIYEFSKKHPEIAMKGGN